MKSGARTHAYHSPLRAEQVAQTRQRILDAIIEELAAGGLKDFSMTEAAKRAGVSERTAYRYFPDREAVLEGLDQLFDERLTLPKTPESLDELPAAVRHLFALFDEHEVLMRARLKTELGQETRLRQRRRRQGIFDELLRAELGATPPEVRRRVMGVLAALLNSQVWRLLRDELDFDGEEAARAVEWALRALLDAIRSGDLPEGEEDGGS